MQCTIWSVVYGQSMVLVAIWLSIIDKTGIHSGIHWIIAIVILIFFHTTFFFETWVGTQVYLSRKFLVWLLWRLSERGQKKIYQYNYSTTVVNNNHGPGHCIHCTWGVVTVVLLVQHTVYFLLYISSRRGQSIKSIDKIDNNRCQSIFNR